MKTEIENFEKNFKKQLENMPKMVNLVTFGGCGARWRQGDLRKPF